MTRAEFLEAVQSRAARVAVGPSAVRGRGNRGVVDAARAHLRNLDLRAFTRGRPNVSRVLEQQTQHLLASLPRAARHWGIARKLLNIFLRDCLYTTYLEEVYRLRRIEKELEIPLDSVTARELKRVAGRGVLPTWTGVKHVTPAISLRFQEVAAEEAARRGIARVHLDAVWWSLSRDDAEPGRLRK